MTAASVSDLFSNFCANIVIDQARRSLIATRVSRMVGCLNEDFRSSTSDSANRFYVGSYGRNTAITSVSDVDVLYQLPWSTYSQYDAYSGNKQSSLLQAIRASVRRTFSTSEIAADGQVVVASFNDGMRVEVLGAFCSTIDSDCTFADSNNGGSWRTCKPKDEISTFAARNSACNGNLVRLCRMMRAWRDYHNVPMSGMLLDTLAYQFLGTWEYRANSYTYYDWMIRDFLLYLANIDPDKMYWLAPGSGSYVWRSGRFQTKAGAGYSLAVSGAANAASKYYYSATVEYRALFGPSFPW